MTPKQKVLRKYPLAYCRWERHGKQIVLPVAGTLSALFPTIRAAWADAARRLKEKR